MFFVNGRPVVLDGKITEERCMAQLRARTPQIMRRHLGKSEFSRVLFHHMPDFSFGYAATPAAARS